jgi:protein tyrosine phosphatase (PTP) superfamily phosphohydrolase (DUF442 family)
MDLRAHGRRRPRPRQIGTFLYVWLTVGFASGTLVLLAPARWITALARERNWGQDAENILMMGMIAIYVVASFAIALALTRLLFQNRALAFKYSLLLGMTTLAGAALWGWGNPAVYASLSGGGRASETLTTESGAVFFFGPYPDRAKLEALKAEGITAVISLQHPAVVPFEPQGIAAEKQATEELGIRFIHAPMLPWVSDNTAALETIRRVASEESGRFYVHCGLGRDRVNVVMHLLEQMGAETGRSEVERAMAWEDREAAGLASMERGKPQRIAQDVWLVPRPNEHELFGNMLAGQAGLVVLLLDPADREQRAGLTEMIGLFGSYAVDYLERPLRPDERARARAIAEEVLRGPRPVTVVVPDMPPFDGEVAKVFLAEWELLVTATASGAERRAER